MIRYSVVDIQEGSIGYMDYTWTEPMTAHELRSKFCHEWNDEADEPYRYCDVTLDNIQEFMEIRLIKFGTQEWAEYNDSDIVDIPFN